MKRIFVLVAGLSANLFAANLLETLDLNALRWDFMQKHKKLNFVREEVGQSDGYLCDGEHYFKVQGQADMKEVEFELHDTYLDAKIDLFNLYGRADGRYRSAVSLCLPVKGWLGLGGDWAHIEARVHLEEQPNSEVPKVRLEILKSEVGTLHFGNGVPGWIEEAVTGIVGRVLRDIWETQLGDWLEAKISESIQKKIEDDRNKR